MKKFLYKIFKILTKDKYVILNKKAREDEISKINRLSKIESYLLHPYSYIEKKVLFLDFEFDHMFYLFKRYKGNSDYLKIDIKNIDFSLLMSVYKYKIIVVCSTYPWLKILNKKFQKIICVWHGIGAFKRCGIFHDITYNKKIPSEKIVNFFCPYIDFMIVSSDKIVNFYAKSFNLKSNQIIPLGLPCWRNKNNNISKNVPNYFYQKKIYIFFPTFSLNNNVCSIEWKINFDKIASLLNDDELILYRLHPRIKNNPNLSDFKEIEKKIVNISNLDVPLDSLNIEGICTDYSSTFFEYYDKKINFVFFRTYITEVNEGIYIDYNSLPGIIIDNKENNLEEKIINALRTKKIDKSKRDIFWKFHADKCDSNAEKRIFNFIDSKLNE